MQSNILSQGLELMLYGMGTVVVFLSLLVVATLLMSAIVRRYFAETVPARAAQPAPEQETQSNDNELVAVIIAAIAQHRSQR